MFNVAPFYEVLFEVHTEFSTHSLKPSRYFSILKHPGWWNYFFVGGVLFEILSWALFWWTKIGLNSRQVCNLSLHCLRILSISCVFWMSHWIIIWLTNAWWKGGFLNVFCLRSWPSWTTFGFCFNKTCSERFMFLLYFSASFLPSWLPALFPLPASPEKLIEGLKSPEPALLLPDILPLADPFGSTSDAVNGKILRASGVCSDLCVSTLNACCEL